jgi:ABC-type bacteriocin/lantibiotic exporter with double-glycine peptidase domain
MDPLWTARTRWGRAIALLVYLGVYVAFLLVIRDTKYPLLWLTAGALIAFGLCQLWFRWAMRRVSEREH